MRDTHRSIYPFYGKYIAWYLFLGVFFLADTLAFAWYHHTYYWVTRTLYYTLLFNATYATQRISAGCAMLLHSFLYTGIFGLDLAVVVPLTALLLYCKRILHLLQWVQVPFIVACLALHQGALNALLGEHIFSCFFTLSCIISHFLFALIMVYYSLR